MLEKLLAGLAAILILAERKLGDGWCRWGRSGRAGPSLSGRQRRATGTYSRRVRHALSGNGAR